MQYFLGYSSFSDEAPFTVPLKVEFGSKHQDCTNHSIFATYDIRKNTGYAVPRSRDKEVSLTLKTANKN